MDNYIEKNRILYKSFQVILFKLMDYEYQEVFHCEDDGDDGVYCNLCDELCIKRFYENHLESSTHTNNNRKRENKIITS